MNHKIIAAEAQIRKILQKAHLAPEAIEKILRADIPNHGEQLDIIYLDAAAKEHVAGSVARVIDHEFGLTHRTENAFVVTPDQYAIFQVRAPWKKEFPLYLSIYGGHVTAGSNCDEARQSEIIEELLNLPKGERASYVLSGYIKQLKRELFLDPLGKNNELRRLSAYIVNVQDLFYIKAYQALLDRKKVELKTEGSFNRWLISQASESGYGEIWGIYFVPLEELIRTDKDYLFIDDIFTGAPRKVYFTPDLLLPIIRNKELLINIKNINAEYPAPNPMK